MRPPFGVGFRTHESGFHIAASTFSTRPITLLFLCGLFWAILWPAEKGPNSLEGAVLISFMMFMTVSAAIWLFISLLGKVVVYINGKDSYVFIGVGPIGCTRRFDWHAVTGIHKAKELDYLAGWTVDAVHIEARKTIVFGRLLSKKRVSFIAEALKYAKLKGI
jgi:hypothetical protein